MSDSPDVVVRPAGPHHQVVSTPGRARQHQRQPCPTCPWRRDAVGLFPAEAFRHSAHTAYDLSTHKFVCHTTGTRRPHVCAGFLLKGAEHNLAVRLGRSNGLYLNVHDGGVALFESYREMAQANGVAPDDPVLTPCRD